MKPKNLVFDLDGTLYPYSKEIENNVNIKSIELFCRHLAKSQSEVWQILQEVRAKGFYETEISACGQDCQHPRLSRNPQAGKLVRCSANFGIS